MENLNNTPMDELNEDLGNAQEKLKRFEDRFLAILENSESVKQVNEKLEEMLDLVLSDNEETLKSFKETTDLVDKVIEMYRTKKEDDLSAIRTNPNQGII